MTHGVGSHNFGFKYVARALQFSPSSLFESADDVVVVVCECFLMGVCSSSRCREQQQQSSALPSLRPLTRPTRDDPRSSSPFSVSALPG